MTETRDSLCPGCSHPQARHCLTTPDMTLLRCRRCRLVYQASWSSAFQPELYEYYRERMSWDVDRVYHPLNRPRLLELSQLLAQRVEGRNLLDVGCGAGQWVAVAAERGWNAMGIDLSPDAIALGTRLGAPVAQTDFFSQELPSGHFHVVSMWELLEHVGEPDRFLRRAAELLRPGGMLVLSTPNFASLGRRTLGDRWPACNPGHLLYYEPGTLRRALEAFFENVTVQTRGLPVPPVRGASPNGSARSAVHARQRATRARIARSGLLRWLKRGVDAGLSRVHVGDTLVAWASLPRQVGAGR